ncbi:hypothetical protein F751_0059, partial [Auxenochlorella protothecoides]
CNSHYVSHFAAFFVDTGAKISVVESCLWLASGPHGQARSRDSSGMGSPTETLLRLLLPLSGRNRDRAANPNTSPAHSIGRSDGRCVQRAGT